MSQKKLSLRSQRRIRLSLAKEQSQLQTCNSQAKHNRPADDVASSSDLLTFTKQTKLSKPSSIQDLINDSGAAALFWPQALTTADLMWIFSKAPNYNRRLQPTVTVVIASKI